MADKKIKNNFTRKDVMRKIVTMMCGKYDVSGWNEQSDLDEIGVDTLTIIEIFLQQQDDFKVTLEGPIFKNCNTLGNIVDVIMQSQKS